MGEPVALAQRFDPVDSITSGGLGSAVHGFPSRQRELRWFCGLTPPPAVGTGARRDGA